MQIQSTQPDLDITARKAAWLNVTFPVACCLFLPRFCFSSSFFFLVTSPPPTVFPALVKTSAQCKQKQARIVQLSMKGYQERKRRKNQNKDNPRSYPFDRHGSSRWQ